MKKIYLSAFLAVLTFLSGTVQAQALALGDIAFTGYNSVASDNFSFIIPKVGGIPAGTQIKFTDRGWSSGACGTNGWAASVEEEIVWTASSAIGYGAQVAITGLTATTGTVTGTALSLSAGGDQIFAYQGSQASASLLAGIHMNEETGLTSATNWDNLPAPTGTQSNRPPCLINGTHALFFSPEVNNARLKSSVVRTGNAATDRSRINNAANWDVDDINEFTLPGNLSGLPVKFTFVKTSSDQQAVALEWGVAEENGTESYTVQRSTDGSVFADLAKLPATGSEVYRYADVTSSTGIKVYYRIAATTSLGKQTYSYIVRHQGAKSPASISVSAQPAQLLLRWTNLEPVTSQWSVVTSMGQRVQAGNFLPASGNGASMISLSQPLPRGIYYLQIESKANRQVAKFRID